MSYSSSIILGVIFMAFGLWLMVYPPKHRNYVIGYRSPISMSCEEAWIEGNRFSGKLLLIGGVIFVIITWICSYMLPDSRDTKAILPIILTLIAVGIIIWTEMHLRRHMKNRGKNNELMM
ncbi:MAG: SdpI family protein [Clostridium sp.]